MAGELIAIVRFKSLPGVSPDERFEARQVTNGCCGPSGRETDCQFFGTGLCARVICDDPPVYFLKKE